ncbi:cell envelope integrity protein TolA [Halioxenophilus aromaticivorans]|uniref:Protein TolA n=1 Tax=Halioxenophilus aromaticivorans TaxID=1306992 RepID=A0AAV3TXA6_9ALTE
MFFSSYVRLPVAVLVSLSLHLGIVALLAWGWEGETETRKPPVQIVQAKLIQLEQTAPKQQAPKVTPKPQQQNVVDLTKKKRAEAEAEKAKQAALKKQREKEAKEKAERDRKAAEKKKAEELKAQQQAAEERKKKALAEELKQLEQQRVQNQLQQELAAAEAAEQAAFAQQQAEATAQSYVAVIARRVEQFWSRPPSARKGMQCELLIQLVPTGRVVNVTVAKSSGNAAFDRSAEQAVLKAEQFKELRDVPSPVFEQYFRELRLVFNPQDLRL